MKNFIQLLILVVLSSSLVLADTPPPGTVKLKGGTDGTTIGNVADALKVNVTNPSATNNVNVHDGVGTSITSSNVAGKQGLDVNVVNATSSTVNQGTGNGGSSPWAVNIANTPIPVTGTFWQATQPVSAVSLPLPLGASTSALQSALITALGSPFQAGGSIGNTAFGISGSLPGFASTPTFNVGTTGGIALDSTLSSFSGKFNSLGQKTSAASAPVVIASDQSTIPVSVSSFPLPTNAAQETGGHLASIDTKLTSPIAIQGGNSTAVKTDGSAVTQPVSAASLPLPSGAATSANQTTANSSLASIVTNTSGLALDSSVLNLSAKFGSLGQKLITGSAPVVIASDQSAIPVTGTFFQATQPVSVASLPLPAGAATSANQTTANTSLASIDSKLTPPLLIQGGNSSAVKTDGSATIQPVSAASLPLPTGAATSANQTAANTSLASIDTKLTSPLTVANPVNPTIAF